MILWIYLVGCASNFIFGALLAILPVLDEVGTGLAFTSLALVKTGLLLPSGPLVDRLGHMRSTMLALLFQWLALLVLYAWPAAAWSARALEGAALAISTVSTVSVLRVLCPDAAQFGRAIGRTMAAGSVGFILGPMFGFHALRFGPRSALLPLGGLSAALVIGQIWATRAFARRGVEGSPSPSPDGPIGRVAPGFVSLVVALGAAKAIGQGIEPLLAYWAPRLHGGNPNLAALSFVLLGAGFVIGASFHSRVVHVAGVGGYLLLELALAGRPMLWWPALASFGFWFGRVVTFAVGKLGWSDLGRLGRTNARWMILTDLPMAMTPFVLWPFREASGGGVRTGLILAMFMVAELAFLRASAQGNPSRAHLPAGGGPQWE